jgi:hypothetical protein
MEAAAAAAGRLGRGQVVWCGLVQMCELRQQVLLLHCHAAVARWLSTPLPLTWQVPGVAAEGPAALRVQEAAAASTGARAAAAAVAAESCCCRCWVEEEVPGVVRRPDRRCCVGAGAGWGAARCCCTCCCSWPEVDPGPACIRRTRVSHNFDTQSTDGLFAVCKLQTYRGWAAPLHVCVVGCRTRSPLPRPDLHSMQLSDIGMLHGEVPACQTTWRAADACQCMMCINAGASHTCQNRVSTVLRLLLTVRMHRVRTYTPVTI